MILHFRAGEVRACPVNKKLQPLAGTLLDGGVREGIGRQTLSPSLGRGTFAPTTNPGMFFCGTFLKGAASIKSRTWAKGACRVPRSSNPNLEAQSSAIFSRTAGWRGRDFHTGYVFHCKRNSARLVVTFVYVFAIHYVAQLTMCGLIVRYCRS